MFHFPAWDINLSRELPWELEGSPGSSADKESACSDGDLDLIPGLVGKIPWRRAWQPAPLFLPGESCRQRRLAGYNVWDHKKSGLSN